MRRKRLREGGRMEDWKKKYLRLILNLTIPIVEILAVCLLGPRLLKFFLPFVIGWIIALIANPLVKFLERRVRLVRRHSSVLIVIAVLALIIGLGYGIISWLVMQAIDLGKHLPELYRQAVEEANAITLRFAHVFALLPDNIQDSWQEFTGNVGATLSILVQKMASPTVEVAGNVAMKIPNILVSVIMTILSAYFFIAEQEKVIDFWKKYIPEGGSRYWNHLKEETKRLIGGYFLAQFKIMFVVAMILAVGFLVLGVHYAVLLGILIAILDFLPLFGTGTVLIPWAIIKLLAGEYALAMGFAVLYVLTQVVRQIVQPKIVGDTMGFSPLMTLVFLYLGFKFRGISGMILAVPIGILIMNLYKFGAFDEMIASAKTLMKEIQRFRKSGKEK